MLLEGDPGGHAHLSQVPTFSADPADPLSGWMLISVLLLLLIRDQPPNVQKNRSKNCRCARSWAEDSAMQGLRAQPRCCVWKQLRVAATRNLCTVNTQDSQWSFFTFSVCFLAVVFCPCCGCFQSDLTKESTIVTSRLSEQHKSLDF